MESEDPHEAQHALMVIKGLPNETSKLAIGDLTDLLESDRRNLTYLASEILAKHGSDAASAVPALLKAIERDDDSQMQGRFMQTLGQIGPKAAAAKPVLLQCFSTNTQSGFRQVSGKALIQIAPDDLKIAETLFRALIDGDQEVSNAFALARPEDVQTLAATAMKSDDEAVRNKAEMYAGNE